MKDIIAIRSAAGSYFEVGKNSTCYYLRSRYTEIHDCEEVFSPSGHPNSCMYIIYADGTMRLFKTQEGIGKNLCAYTSDAADYSEFFPSILESSNLLTLQHLRQVCREEGKEDFSYFLKAVRDLVEDYKTQVILGRPRNGETTIVKNILGLVIDPFVSISEDGEIIETGGLRFVEVLKKTQCQNCMWTSPFQIITK